MKRLLSFFSLLSIAFLIHAQPNSGFGFGVFGALPQNDLKEANYDNGFGANLSLYSKPISLGGEGLPLSLQFGVRFDWADMQERDFEVELNTPVTDMGTLEVNNSMYGLLGAARISYGTGRFLPYGEFLIGHRNYHTKQSITAQNPNLNPDYEDVSYANKVVWNKKPHVGFGAGISYQIKENFSLESGFTYTIGQQGYVMPLDDVSQTGNEINYDFSNVKTDILLINVGIRFSLKRNYSSIPNGTPTEHRNDDTYREQSRPRRSGTVNSPNHSPKTGGAKKSLEPKTNGSGTKGGGVNH